MGPTISFTRMSDAVQADHDILATHLSPYLADAPDRYLATLLAQKQERESGYRVDRCEHAVQSATRARQSGADADWIVAALLHDIGDGLAPMNHDRMAAEIMRPFVREEVTWTVAHHGAFQLHYTGKFNGSDPLARERFRDSPYFDSCASFCANWDQVSFDPDFRSDPLESFRPELEEVFSRTAYDAAHVLSKVVFGIPS
jgi:predicted HD phosphohydrolase